MCIVIGSVILCSKKNELNITTFLLKQHAPCKNSFSLLVNKSNMLFTTINLVCHCTLVFFYVFQLKPLFGSRIRILPQFYMDYSTSSPTAFEDHCLGFFGGFLGKNIPIANVIEAVGHKFL